MEELLVTRGPWRVKIMRVLSLRFDHIVEVNAAFTLAHETLEAVPCLQLGHGAGHADASAVRCELIATENHLSIATIRSAVQLTVGDFESRPHAAASGARAGFCR